MNEDKLFIALSKIYGEPNYFQENKHVIFMFIIYLLLFIFNNGKCEIKMFDFSGILFQNKNLRKVLEIFYIKDKKKYSSVEMATKAFMDDFKNYMQNPLESILYNPSRFHSYLVDVYGRDDVSHLLSNATGPITPEEYKNIFGDLEPGDPRGDILWREFLINHPERRQQRDNQYIGQLRKFFTNVYLKNAPKFMPEYEPPVMPFNASQAIKSNTEKD